MLKLWHLPPQIFSDNKLRNCIYFRLHITTESWKKDSFGLFDFECKELQM